MRKGRVGNREMEEGVWRDEKGKGGMVRMEGNEEGVAEGEGGSGRGRDGRERRGRVQLRYLSRGPSEFLVTPLAEH